MRSVCAWRYLPANFPPWQTALHRAEWEFVWRHLDPSAAIKDSQSVKMVEESADFAVTTPTNASTVASGTCSLSA